MERHRPGDRPQVPGFEILELIAEGAFGIVWRAQGLHDCPIPELRHEPAAIKVLRDPWTGPVPPLPPRHRNLGTVYALLSTTDGRSAVVMAYVPGRSLRRYFDELRGHPPPERLEGALVVLERVLSGLEVLHAHGLPHLDIKPENILCRGRWEDPEIDVRIIDPPFPRPIGGGKDVDRLPGGTPYYVAPEQLAGITPERPDGRADVFSASLLLAEAVLADPAMPRMAGPMPPSEKAMLALTGFNPEDCAKRVGQVSIRLEPVLRLALRYKPEERLEIGLFLTHVRRVRQALAKTWEFPAPRIMVLSDDWTFAEAVRDALQEAGYPTEVVSDIAIALRSWRAFGFLVADISGTMTAEDLDTLLEVWPPLPMVVVGRHVQERHRIEVLKSRGDLETGSRSVSVVRLRVERVQKLVQAHLDARELETLRRRTASDPVTGLLLRPALEEQIQRMIARLKTHGTSFHLLMFDADDGIGLEETVDSPVSRRDRLRLLGDTVAQTRGVDTPGRDDVFPNQFYLLCPRTKLTEALKAARRLHGKTDLGAVDGEGMIVTWSIGVAGFPKDGQTARDLFTCAEERLLRAQQDPSGGICWGDGPDDIEFPTPD